MHTKFEGLGVPRHQKEKLKFYSGVSLVVVLLSAYNRIAYHIPNNLCSHYFPPS